jgi:hypothetical protein
VPGVGVEGWSAAMDLASLELSVERYRMVSDHASPQTQDDGGRPLARLHLTPEDAGPPSTPAGHERRAVDVDGDAASDGSGNRIRPTVCVGVEWPVISPWVPFADYRYAFQNLTFQDPFDHGLWRVGLNYAF